MVGLWWCFSCGCVFGCCFICSFFCSLFCVCMGDEEYVFWLECLVSVLDWRSFVVGSGLECEISLIFLYYGIIMVMSCGIVWLCWSLWGVRFRIRFFLSGSYIVVCGVCNVYWGYDCFWWWLFLGVWFVWNCLLEIVFYFWI